MEAIETSRIESSSRCVITVPLGLLGFEQHKRFVLLANPSEEPFLWLQVMDDPKLAFLVVSPFAVAPGYQPEIADEDVEFLDLRGPDDTLTLSIVTVRSSQQATLNLKGPIVINRRTLRAKQVIPVNAPELSVAHPLTLHAS